MSDSRRLLPGLRHSPGLSRLRRPEPLDPARHSYATFASGEPTLDEWLQKFAGQNRRRDTAATWVIADEGNVVVAYASLSATSVDISRAPAALAKHSPKLIPALLLGRLAVDQRYAKQGVGTILVAHVLATAVELNVKVACRAVIVNALNPQARTWWQRFGFQTFNPSNPDDLDLYLLAKDIEATLGAMTSI